MKALVKYDRGPLKVRIQDMPVPEPAAGQVRIRTKAAGICGTDVHIYFDDGYPTSPPAILGHELSGVIDKIGDGVTGVSEGMRVTSETYFYTCGTCGYCRTGRSNLCMHKVSIGSGTHGAFADYVVVPAHNIHRLPENLGYEEGAIIEPLSCCVQAVFEKTVIRPTDTVLITGPGCIGLLCLQLVKQFNARCIVMGAPHDGERLSLARRLGADLVLFSSQSDVQESVGEFCDGKGPDVFLECSGSEAAINTGIELLRKGGVYTQVGLARGKISIDINKLTLKEIAFSGTYATKWYSWHKSIELLEDGLIRLEPLITDKVELDEWQPAFEEAARGVGVKHVFIFP